jgi:hypothetical protein
MLLSVARWLSVVSAEAGIETVSAEATAENKSANANDEAASRFMSTIPKDARQSCELLF